MNLNEVKEREFFIDEKGKVYDNSKNEYRNENGEIEMVEGLIIEYKKFIKEFTELLICSNCKRSDVKTDFDLSCFDCNYCDMYVEK